MSREQFIDKFQQKWRKENVQIAPADGMGDIQAIPTGILSFDTSTGIGGFPRGRIVEVFGPESGGKSLLTLVSVAYAQRKFDATTLYLDIEGGTPREWLETLGINLKKFDIIPAGLSAEQNLDSIILAINEACYDYIIVDSVAGMVSSAELAGEIDKNYMAELARAMSKGLKKIVATLGKLPVEDSPCLIFINQIREKPGVMFGSPETTPGGRALKFYSSQRYRVTKKPQSEVTEGGDIVGHSIAVKNVKNKLGPPKREGEFYIHYTKGVDIAKSIMTMVRQRKLYEKIGQKYCLHLDKDMTFNTVGDIEKEISQDIDFQTRVYTFLMQSYIGGVPEIEKIDEFEDEFK